jgi:putative oxidoreductase
MKFAVVVVRVVMGLLFLTASLAYFLKLMPAGELSENARLFMTGLFASIYVMPVVKTIELLCAIAFLSNRFVSLALIVIFPINLNIFLFHAFMAPEAMAVPALLFLGNVFLFFVHRKNYQPVLAIR